MVIGDGDKTEKLEQEIKKLKSEIFKLKNQ